MEKDMYHEPFGRKINDADGDGVEDNVKKTQGELDRFRKPVFGTEVNDIHNTRHGNLPGHTNEGFQPEPTLKKEASKENTSLQTEIDDLDANSYNDKSYIQTEESSSQELLSKFVDIVDSPEALTEDNLL